MRRIGVGLAGCLAVVAAAAGTRGGATPLLPLHSPQPRTLLAIVSGQGGSRLAQLEPATLTVERRSSQVGPADGWVRSPDGKLLAVATYEDDSNATIAILRFANAATLGWARSGVTLDGDLAAAIWPRSRTLYALADDCCDANLTLDTVDTVAKRIVARTRIVGTLVTAARSDDGLVLLTAADNAIRPARLVVVGADGSVRAVRLTRILAGTHFDRSSPDPVGSTRQPALAVDPAAGVAYIIDPDGLVAAVRLDDLTVGYHRLGSGSLLGSLADWLTPPAQAKGLDGPALSAHWLGDGLITLSGTTNFARQKADGSLIAVGASPYGLRIIDTNNWTSHLLDPHADTALAADGVLLTSGSSWRSGRSSTTVSGEGIAAYGPDEALRWRLDPRQPLTLVAAYGTHALIQRNPTGTSTRQRLQLVDLTTGHVLRSLPGDDYPWLLLGIGS